jgi:type 1 glutamine amidotransferase
MQGMKESLSKQILGRLNQEHPTFRRAGMRSPSFPVNCKDLPQIAVWRVLSSVWTELVGIGIVVGFPGAFANSEPAEHLPSQKIRALIVTGVDYPGHDWRATSRKLQEILSKDPHIEPRIVEDIEILATDLIYDYQVLIIHFKNYGPPRREAEVYRNLEQFVKKGGGLLLTHFACGAFEEWPGFIRIAGRVWDKNKRAHDPWGKFDLRIVDPEHPIVRNIASFEINDELYTCLGGEESIHLLAVARSRVDGQDYPMIFVRTVDRGRVVHSVLGHDLRAYEPEAYQEVLRRAVRWLASAKPIEAP